MDRESSQAVNDSSDAMEVDNVEKFPYGLKGLENSCPPFDYVIDIPDSIDLSINPKVLEIELTRISVW